MFLGTNILVSTHGAVVRAADRRLRAIDASQTKEIEWTAVDSKENAEVIHNDVEEPQERGPFGGIGLHNRGNVSALENDQGAINTRLLDAVAALDRAGVAGGETIGTGNGRCADSGEEESGGKEGARETEEHGCRIKSLDSENE